MGTGLLSGIVMIVGIAWLILEACKHDVQYQKNQVKMREQWRQEARDEWKNK